MDKIDKVYYINLNRRPDRNENFLKECKKARIPEYKIKRFEAFDGLSLWNKGYRWEFIDNTVKLNI